MPDDARPALLEAVVDDEGVLLGEAEAAYHGLDRDVTTFLDDLAANDLIEVAPEG